MSREKSAAFPAAAHMTAFAGKDAMSVLVRSTDEMFLWSSSTQNSTPARGALKAAEMPAAAPAVARKCRSSPLPSF